VYNEYNEVDGNLHSQYREPVDGRWVREDDRMSARFSMNPDKKRGPDRQGFLTFQPRKKSLPLYRVVMVIVINNAAACKTRR
jgi:hypothetical protein